jgi:hypothetical protein
MGAASTDSGWCDDGCRLDGLIDLDGACALVDGNAAPFLKVRKHRLHVGLRWSPCFCRMWKPAMCVSLNLPYSTSVLRVHSGRQWGYGE